MKILVAVDFSPVGREVAHAGYRLAKKIGSEITFFHCAPQTARFLQGYDIKAFVSSTGKDEQKKIGEMAKQKLHKIMEDVFAENGVAESLEIEEEVVFGEPGDELLKFAKEKKTDLIIVGYKSYSMIEHLLVGSTASKVARYAPCSVMIYRPDKD
ncbi:MAG: universal stress protein [Synergistaceae bacterium]|jgi:nucleotide-binding universal stress UspA family protein|nr:universal stress protein [Synergistaceae bacterium]MCK9436848.1 universal stress protein [Synergistaceae bacterium]MDD3319398.1 universal stress protein [Synergistaceae bacterium]MDD4705331.1 universal stress protein [Synergistaceae bacterium]NLW61806.1 universal stress protein [Synergistaceae bacterium]